MATFSPPTVDDQSRLPPGSSGPGRALWRHYSSAVRGRSVLKNRDGTYTIVDTPTGDQIEAAAYAYIGGHDYEVTSEEAAALVAAGFTVQSGDEDIELGGPYTWETVPGTWATQTLTWAAV